MSFTYQPHQTSTGEMLAQGLGAKAGQGIQQSLAEFQRAKSFEKAGLPREFANLDPAIISQLVKQQQKNALIQQIMGGLQQGESEGGIDSLSPQEQNPLEPKRLDSSSGLDKNKQIQALSLVDPNLARVMESQEAPIRKAGIARATKFLDKVEDSRKSVQRAKSSLLSAESALAEKDLGYFSRDNLANITGVEGLRSKEGAVFNAAAKNFFLADLESSVGRPNQFLEKILTKAIFDVGKSNEANEALLKFYKNQVDIDEKKIEISDQLEDFYTQKMGYVPGNIGRLVDAQLKPYALEKEKELESQFKSFAPGKEKGLTQEIAQDILKEAKGDKQLARKIAKKRGFEF